MRLIRSLLVPLLLTAGALVAAPGQAQAATICSSSDGARYICEYGREQFHFDNGVDQQFVVGTDWAVWTRYERTATGPWTGWAKLSGSAYRNPRMGDPNNFYVYRCGTQPHLLLDGTDGQKWRLKRHPTQGWASTWIRASIPQACGT